jgi:WD40 repeat protein
MRTRLPLPLSASSVLACVTAVALLLCASVAAAQTPFVPYFGKNRIHYDNFEWHIYTTDHFEIYYYPEMEQHLARLAGYAESAYQQISADLKHDLPFKIQLIFFKTHSEFEQENVLGIAAEGIGAFAEPVRQRMLVPIDDPPDRLYGLVVHELTHQFQFDIIPQSLVRRNYPLWVSEGGAEIERGQWTPFDLMTVRDAAVADIVPKMSETEAYGNTTNPRLVPYNLGHALFEFVEEKWGKEGIRQFMFSLRKSVIGGGEDAYEEAFKMKPEEFDQAFDRYLKERFKPFRDKERPADYGPDLAPNREKTPFSEAYSIAPSPSGDLLAVVTGNRKDQELDIVLVSSKDGSIVRNLTAGFNKDMGFTNLVYPGGGERPEYPWMSWSPRGDRLAYFVRTEKERTLIIQNVLTRKIEVRIPMRSVDEPESPSFSPDGKTIAFAGLRAAVSDIFIVNLETQEVTNLTNDEFGDYAPTYSPDGKFLIFNARVSGNQKLFRLDLDSGQKTQITFGTVDEVAAQFIDQNTIIFASTATDPTIALDPAVARNGNVYNLWTLDLGTGELRQFTDVVGGNWSPAVLHDGDNRIAFVTYFKGEYSIRTLDRKDALHTAASSDFGSPGPIIDFQAPMQHTLIADNSRRKKPFEKMFLEGRPPVNVGVTSGGDVFGGSQISFGDVTGDRQINVYIASISQYRTMAASFINLSRRFQYALQGFSQTQFFYGQNSTIFYDPIYSEFIDRDLAQATRTERGGSALGIYPLNRYRRLQVSGGYVNLNEEYNDSELQALADQYQIDTYGRKLFRNGSMIPFGVEFIQETTVFRDFGPLAGNTVRVAYDVAPPIGGLLSRQTVEADVRHYLRLGSNGLLATRFKGFKSWGDYPDFTYFGGNSELRGYDYLSFSGQNAFFANAELRFPLIEAALTPIGVIGGIRGVFFANIGSAYFDGEPSQTQCVGSPDYEFWTRKQETCQAVLGVDRDAFGLIRRDANGNASLRLGPPVPVSGFRLKDGRASYGVGIETFALGFPVHFDWAWRTLFSRDWEDVVFASVGGSEEFRKAQFSLWIGYDF